MPGRPVSLAPHIRQRIEGCANDEKCVLDGSDAWSCLNEIERLEKDLTDLRTWLIKLADEIARDNGYVHDPGLAARLREKASQ